MSSSRRADWTVGRHGSTWVYYGSTTHLVMKPPQKTQPTLVLLSKASSIVLRGGREGGGDNNGLTSAERKFASSKGKPNFSPSCAQTESIFIRACTNTITSSKKKSLELNSFLTTINRPFFQTNYPNCDSPPPNPLPLKIREIRFFLKPESMP